MSGIFEIKDGVLISVAKNHGLKDIVIPDGVVTVKSGAFRGDEQIESVYIPDSVDYIQTAAFYKCKNLKKVRVSKNVKTIYENTFSTCGLEEVELPEGIEDIYPFAFAHCEKLKNVEFPSTLFRILDGGFYGCTALKSVYLPKGLRVMEKNVFAGCKNLDVYCEDAPGQGWVDKVETETSVCYSDEDDAFNFHRSSSGWASHTVETEAEYKWNPLGRPVHTGVSREQFRKIIGK